MEITKYQLLKAAAYTRGFVRDVIGVSINDVKDSDKEILNRYLDLGIIKYTTKKINYSREIYFPTIESDRYDGITVDFWRVIVRQCLQTAGHSVNLSKASSGDYMSKSWKYDIAPSTLKRSEASASQKKLELEVLDDLIGHSGGY